MRKAIIFSSLALLLFSSSLYGDRFEHREHKQVKKPHHVVQSVRDEHRHSRPSIKKKHYTKKSHIRKPHHYVANHRRPGHRVKHLHRDTFYFSHSGIDYHYTNGAFYRPYRNGYRVVRAPVGAFIYDLPHGFVRIYVGNHSYYRYEDTYYERDMHRSGYRVIREPVRDIPRYRYNRGDVVLTLPRGAIEVIIDGAHYYEFGDIYFSLSLRNERRIYTVVDVY